MPRVGFALAVSLVAGLPSAARADETQIGGFFGPRFFSQESRLGYIATAPAHPMLQNGIAIGARLAREFGIPYLLPELEIAFCPTSSTTPLNAVQADIYWIDPRAQLRLQFLPGQRFQPFAIIGGGAPIAISSARKTLNSGIIGEGFVGGGVRLDTGKGLTVRVDARISLIPGAGPPTVTAEAEIDIGLEVQIGRKPKPLIESKVTAVPVADRDGDAIADSRDECPDRPEDKDGFEDDDGCPDIDNDGDHVLDVADACPSERETQNGFEDEDGCVDTVPAEVQALTGTITGLLFAERQTDVRASAAPKIRAIADAMTRYPSLAITLIGHTDDREANAIALPPDAGQAPPDAAASSRELAFARAQAVREALVAAGVSTGRIAVETAGADEPAADNTTPKGRLANRRVQLKLTGAR